MLKKVSLFVLIAVLTASSVMAQYTVDIGVQAGLNFANFWGSDAGVNQTKPGIILGAVIDNTKLAKRNGSNFSLQLGLLFVQQGAKEESESIEVNLNYLRMPYNVRYNFDLGSNMGLYLQAGIYGGLALWGTEKARVDGKWESDKIYFGDNDMNRWDWGIGVGAGVRIMDNFQIGVSKNWGRNSLIKYEGVKQYFYNTNLALTATYLLPDR